jgi:hypothetical protein
MAAGQAAVAEQLESPAARFDRIDRHFQDIGGNPAHERCCDISKIKMNRHGTL